MKLQFSNPFTSKPGVESPGEAQASLRKWNRNLAILHALQGVAILVLSPVREFPLTASFLTKDTLASSAAGHTVLAPASQVVHNLNVAYIIAAFFFVAAITHGLMATKYRVRYEAELKKGLNRVRWLEYALGASLMLVAVAIISGIYDVGTLFLVFVLTAVTSLLGLMMELSNPLPSRRAPEWMSYWAGCFTSVAPWLVILGTIIAAQLYGSGDVPGYVYAIYVSIGVLFAGYGAHMYLHYKKQGKWASYYYTERGYMLLGLVAKTVLAWQIFAGALRP